MKILIEPSTKNNLYQTSIHGLILSLEKYSVQSNVYFSLEEIKQIREENPSLEIFVNINKNLSTIIQSLNVSYSNYFNKKYERSRSFIWK